MNQKFKINLKVSVIIIIFLVIIHSKFPYNLAENADDELVLEYSLRYTSQTAITQVNYTNQIFDQNIDGIEDIGEATLARIPEFIESLNNPKNGTIEIKINKETNKFLSYQKVVSNDSASVFSYVDIDIPSLFDSNLDQIAVQTIDQSVGYLKNFFYINSENLRLGQSFKVVPKINYSPVSITITSFENFEFNESILATWRGVGNLTRNILDQEIIVATLDLNYDRDSGILINAAFGNINPEFIENDFYSYFLIYRYFNLVYTNGLGLKKSVNTPFAIDIFILTSPIVFLIKRKSTKPES